MKASLILTARNEFHTVDGFFKSILNQTLKPEEIIITIADSDDNTLEKISDWQGKIPNLKIIQAGKANRSAGRNIAIKNSANPFIVITDFGCIPQKDWFEKILDPLKNENNDIVSGYYISTNKNLLSVIFNYFTHPSLGEIDPEEFLPSARSIAFKKKCWENIGGFPEWLNYAEDSFFDLKLKNKGFKFIFNPEAIVEWNHENKIFTFFKKIFNYSKGDSTANLFSKLYIKKILAFFTVLAGFILAIFKTEIVLLSITLLFFYFIKTYIHAYLKVKRVFFPLLICITKPFFDLSRISGFLSGKFKKIFSKNNKLTFS